MTDQDKKPMRPDPIPRIDSAFFWEACERGELVIQQSPKTGKLYHPPRAICPDSLSAEKSEKTMSGRATVLSWVRQIRPASYGFRESPYVILVELEEGPRLVSNYMGDEPPEFGQAVIVDFVKTSGGKSVPVFKATS